jgi:hypothetical protein
MNNYIILNADNNEIIFEYLYTVDNYVTFNLKIKSGDFAGSSNFCISKEKIVSIVETLSNMNKDLTGSCELRDYDSDAYIKIEMLKLGHLCIYGQIGGSHQDQFLKFKLTSDQTILNNFIYVFKKI